ncbi:MAG TPA: serine hydrolase domain-containing protein, partial [Gemmatimonadales bacterium]|nr:serine hydrolase domain-containing protein [Gemmatimonadales bacterium]
MSLSRRHFMMGTAGALLGAARAKVAWPAQAVLSAGRSTGPSWAPSATFLRQLPRLLELASVPGLSLGVVENGRAWTRGFGYAVADPAQPAVPETVFEAASLGKPLFAYAVLKLVDAKALELDRALYHYLPL